jgi:hypothetical protein
VSVLTPAQITVRDAVVKQYLKDCQSLSVADIAKLVHRSEIWVRRAMDETDAGGNVAGLSWHKDERSTYSKSSPDVPTGSCLVRVYAPATWYLRDLLLAERLATRALESTVVDLRARYEKLPSKIVT